jgi:hypothetical protein
VGARFSAPVQTGPGTHPASCTIDTGSFPGVKSGRGVTLTPHPLLVPWSWKGILVATPLLPLWAVRPVQSLSACTRVSFKHFYYIGLCHGQAVCLLCGRKWNLYRFCFWLDSLQWVRACTFPRFLDHTQRPTTGGRTPLDKWSACRRNIYLTTHNIQNRQTFMTRGGGVWTHILSRRAAAVLHLRPRGRWDKLYSV